MTAQLPPLPRHLDSAATFDAMVNWVHDEIIVKRGAPGLAISVSGTDSVLAFLACAKAYAKAGKPNRVAAIHYDEKMPPEPELSNRLAENPQAFWFQRQVLPWLQQQAPEATFLVDDSIEYYRDGARWGALLDWSVMQDMKSGVLRPREESYWVVGTRNRTEQELKHFSNVSAAASVQPIVHLWKSEVLQLCEYLGVPPIAMQKSCEADCVCGRDQLPAMHIPEVDALLMTRNGELAPEYVNNTISPSLRTALNGYIDTQLKSAAFKEHIPYNTSAVEPVLDSSLDVAALEAVKAELMQPHPDTKPLSRLLPDIIRHGHANAACDLLGTASPDRTSWLAEALMLFATPNLHINQKQAMLQHLFGVDHIGVPAVKRLSECCARLGNYAFSFPKWRFTSMRSGDTPSLVEQFGMTRLERDTDFLDASLPASNPNRDLHGTGFEWHDDTWYVEYRRGYVVCSNRDEKAPITLVICNSSYFFGRDRLPAPVYVSFKPLALDTLHAISSQTLEQSGDFMRWQDVATHPDAPALAQIALRTDKALGYLDAFDANLNRWLTTDGPCEHVAQAGPDHSAASEVGGKSALEAFLQSSASKSKAMGKPALYVGEVPVGSAPWFPSHVCPPTNSSTITPRSNLALLSGEHGDFPLIGERLWQDKVQRGSGTRVR